MKKREIDFKRMRELWEEFGMHYDQLHAFYHDAVAGFVWFKEKVASDQEVSAPATKAATSIRTSSGTESASHTIGFSDRILLPPAYMLAPWWKRKSETSQAATTSELSRMFVSWPSMNFGTTTFAVNTAGQRAITTEPMKSFGSTRASTYGAIFGI